MPITHAKVSVIPDGANPNQVQASTDWNADHVGAGGLDYVQVADPGAVGAGKTWLRLPPDIAPDPWGQVTDYALASLVQPITPNGHWYQVLNEGGGTSDSIEPVWPTDGSTVEDGTLTWQDQGLLIPVVVNSLQLWVRNATDDDWTRVGNADTFAGDFASWSAYDAVGVAFGSFLVSNDGAKIEGIDASVRAGSDGIVHVKVGDYPEVQVLIGLDDPSAGAGIEAPMLSTYRRHDSGAGTFWFKTGAGDTDWRRLRPVLEGTADPSAGGGVASELGSQYTRDNAGTGELWFKTGAADTDWTLIV